MRREFSIGRWQAPGMSRASDRIAEEVAVALTYNRQSHVVMMATPADLEDFALGFSLSEGIIQEPADLLATRVIPRDQGVEVAMTVTEDCFERISGQRRNLTGRTGCGLCGAESIEQAIRTPAPVPTTLRFSHQAVQRAVAALQGPLPLQSETGAVHCAGWFDLDGELLAVREDVGRHNALDKLIGGLFAAGFQRAAGFITVSSRASYEMVYKSVAAGAEMLVAVSAPTALAVDHALQAGLTLVGFARPGRHNVYTFPERIFDAENGDGSE